MIVNLISRVILSKTNSDQYPQSLIDHVNKKIKKWSERIESDYSDHSKKFKNSMKLKLSDFNVVLWSVDGNQYYDIHHFKQDAEVGHIMKYENDVLIEICEIDEAALEPSDDIYSEWCEEFENIRTNILEL